MKKVKRDKSFYKKAGTRIGTIIGIVCICFILITNVQIKEEPQGEWHIVFKGSLAEAAEATPGAGASGFLEFFYINHTASPSTVFAENASATLESWCTTNMVGKTPYFNADNSNVELQSQQSFNLLYRGRGNATHCANATMYKDTRVRVRISFNITTGSWADGNDEATLTEMTVVASRNTSGGSFLWFNAYLNADDNNGYQLDDDAILTITMIELAFFY